MPDNIWLYGFDGFNGLKTVGFVVADTDTEAEHKVWRMYNDFGTDEYDLDDLVVWRPRNDENYREDYPDVMEIVYQKGVNKMKITDERIKKKGDTFKNVELGDVFEHLGDIYLKVEYSFENNNAYNLNTGKFATLSDSIVTPLEAELVIRDTKNMIGQNDKTELIGGIIDIFEDFLDKKGVTLEPPKKSYEMELDDSTNANIYGSDYDSISDSLESLLRGWKVIE